MPCINGDQLSYAHLFERLGLHNFDEEYTDGLRHLELLGDVIIEDDGHLVWHDEVSGNLNDGVHFVSMVICEHCVDQIHVLICNLLLNGVFDEPVQT